MTARYPASGTASSSAARARLDVVGGAEQVGVGLDPDGPVGEGSATAGAHRPTPAARSVLSFDSCTFGWSKGLMPSTRPATAVAYSQARNCAPRPPRATDPPAGALPPAATTWQRWTSSADASRRVEALDDDGQQPASLLAGRLRDQLLGPVAEAGQVVPGREREVAAAVDGPSAQRRPEGQRVGRPVEPGPQRRRVVEQRGDVDAGQRARHQPERGQRAVAPADVRVGEHDVAEARLLAGRLQLRAGVGHRDEAAADVVDPGLAQRRLEDAAVAVGLDGRPALGADDDERPAPAPR